MIVPFFVLLIVTSLSLIAADNDWGPGPGWNGDFLYADAPSNYPFDRFACMLNIDEVPGDCFAKEFTCTKDDEPPAPTGIPRMLDTDEGFHCCTCKEGTYRRVRDGQCIQKPMDGKCSDGQVSNKGCRVNEVEVDVKTITGCDVTCEMLRDATQCDELDHDESKNRKCRCKDGYARDGHDGPCIERMLCFVIPGHSEYSVKANQ